MALALCLGDGGRRKASDGNRAMVYPSRRMWVVCRAEAHLCRRQKPPSIVTWVRTGLCSASTRCNVMVL